MHPIIKKLERWKNERKLSNSQLAVYLKTTQQNVSRWLRGDVTPKEETLKEIQQLIDDVTTSADELPLRQLTPEKFECFCMDLAVMRGHEDAMLYGVRGGSQRGIDILCPESGLVIQCKRTNIPRWQKGNTKEAIDKYEKHKRNDKEKILAVTADINSPAMDYAEQHGWKIYGLHKLTRIVWSLMPDQREKLIRAYFSNSYVEILKKVYGEILVSSLIIADDYFKNIEENDRFISFETPFMKNDDEFNRIISEIDSKNNRVIVVSGSGGIGKTRLVKELSQKSNKDFYFYVEGSALSRQDLSKLDNRHVLVIDDAHRKSEITEQVIQYILSEDMAKTPKLLICTRPIFEQRIYTVVDSCGLSRKFFKLERLDQRKSIELADKICKDSLLAPYIAEISDGNPLILTLASKYTNEKGRLPRNLLDYKGSGRALRAIFEDIIYEIIGSAGMKDWIKEILQCLSILQPFPNNKESKMLLADFLKCEPMKIERELELLLNSGVLIETLDGLRFYPDLFGDYLRDDAVTKDKRYCEEILKYFKGKFLKNILQNISLLDWNTSYKKVSSEQLSLVWEEVKRQISSAETLDKKNIMSSVYQVASSHPGKAIDFARYISESAQEFVFKLPKILTQTATKMEFLETSIRFIYDLAIKFPNINDDVSEFTPLASLKEIVRYHVFKNTTYNHEAMRCCIQYYPDNGSVPFSLLDILDELFRVEGSSSYLDVKNLTIYQYSMEPQDIEPLLQTTTEIIFKNLESDNVRQSLRAAKSIESIFQMLGRNEKYKNILGEVYSEIKRMIANCELSPITIAYIRKGLTGYLGKIDIEDRVNFEAYDGIDEYCISIAIIDCYYNYIFKNEDYNLGRNKYNDWLESTARVLIERNHDEEKLIEKIINVTKLLENDDVGRSSINYRMVYALCQNSEPFCESLLAYIFMHPEDDIFIGLQFSSALMHTYKTHGAKEYALEYGIKAAKSGRIELQLGTTALLDSTVYRESEEEVNLLIKELVKINNTEINHALILAILRINNDDPRLSEKLAKFLIENSVKKNRINMTIFFSPKYRVLSLTDMNEKSIHTIIDNLSEINELDNESVEFLRNLQLTHTDVVAELFEKRIENVHKHETFTSRYSPLPYNTSLDMVGFVGRKFIDHIIKWAEDNQDNIYLTIYVPKLLKLALSDDNLILHKIGEQLNVVDTNMKMLRLLISSLKTETLWEKQKYLESILSLAYQTKSLDEYQKICLEFIGLRIPDGDMRSVGSYSDHDLKVLKNIKTALERTSETSKIYPIFKQIEKGVQRSMEEDMRRDKLIGYY